MRMIPSIVMPWMMRVTLSTWRGASSSLTDAPGLASLGPRPGHPATMPRWHGTLPVPDWLGRPLRLVLEAPARPREPRPLGPILGLQLAAPLGAASLAGSEGSPPLPPCCVFALLWIRHGAVSRLFPLLLRLPPMPQLSCPCAALSAPHSPSHCRTWRGLPASFGPPPCCQGHPAGLRVQAIITRARKTSLHALATTMARADPQRGRRFPVSPLGLSCLAGTALMTVVHY